MGKLDTSYSTFGRGKKVSEEEAVKALEWTEKYVEIFDDPYMNNAFIKILRSRFVSETFLEGVNKRMHNIPIDKNNYVAKFRSPVRKLMMMTDPRFSHLTKKVWTGEDKDICVSMLETFKKWNYLTLKQISFVKYLFVKKFGGPNGREVKSEFTKTTDLVLNLVLTSNFKEDYEKTEGGFTAAKMVVHEAKKKKKEISTRGFMTLSEIRKKHSA